MRRGITGVEGRRDKRVKGGKIELEEKESGRNNEGKKG